jgi:hypothetical protein
MASRKRGEGDDVGWGFEGAQRVARCVEAEVQNRMGHRTL